MKENELVDGAVDYLRSEKDMEILDARHLASGWECDLYLLHSEDRRLLLRLCFRLTPML